jgi:HAE1 family hydrophobic/amphiphilic exporter-1
MLFTAFVVMGIYSLPKLKVEAMPEVALPSLTVTTSWNGASPKSIQRAITLPIEEAVRRVKGVENVKSTSSMGQSRVEVEFSRDRELDFARLDLNEQLGTVRRNLPLTATQPQIVAFVPEEVQTKEFFVFSLQSTLSANELREQAETWILPQVLAVDGVADAQVRGGARKLLRITLDRTKLNLYGITAEEVFRVVSQLDDLSGAGTINQFGLEKLVSLRDPVTIANLPQEVVARRGGREYTLGMLGTVTPSFEDPTVLVRTNGKNVVDVIVEKRSGANTVTVSRNLKKQLPIIKSRVPFPVDYEVQTDQGKELRDKLEDLVVRSIIILVVLFLLLALSLKQIRLTAIVIGSILFSIVICLSLFYFFHISVNFITISGLTICFGLLLDNSILVLDSIHRRLESLDRANAAGLSRKDKLEIAARNIVAGTQEVLFPVMATTLTTIVAFLSFIFLSGRLALFYVPLAVAVAMAMGASLFVAFGWIPMVLNQGWVRSVVRRSPEGARECVDENELGSFVEEIPDLDRPPSFFEKIIEWNQRLWWVIVPLLGLLFFYSWTIYDKKVDKAGFFHFPDPQQILLFLRMPAGTRIETTSDILQKFEDSIMPVAPGVHARARCFGSIALIEIDFDDDVVKTEIPLRYRAELVAVADQTAGANVFIRGFADTPYFRGNLRGASGNSLIKITGYNSYKLDQIADDAVNVVRRQRRVRNARISTSSQFRATPPEESVISIDRERLASYQMSVSQLVASVRRLIGVDIPWSMMFEGKQERVLLSFDDSETMDYDALAQTLIRTPSGERVRLGELVTLSKEDIPGDVTRENQRYSVFVNWEYIGTDRMREAYIKNVLAGLDLPYGYEAEESEQTFFTPEEEEELTLTLALAAAFIFMVMAALFESVSLPLLVAFSIPMGLVGVVLTYWKSNTPFDSSARIGLVLLFGIVVNNAILLVSRFRHESSLILKAKLGGSPQREASLFPGKIKELGGSDLWMLPPKERPGLLRRAVSRGVRVRLRSILLTSGTTVLGLVPLLLSETRILGWLSFLGPQHANAVVNWLVHLFPVLADSGEGQEIWENLALSSIGGLLSSTVLILIAIPALYYLGVRLCWIWRAFLARIRAFAARHRVQGGDSSAVSGLDLG